MKWSSVIPPPEEGECVDQIIPKAQGVDSDRPELRSRGDGERREREEGGCQGHGITVEHRVGRLSNIRCERREHRPVRRTISRVRLSILDNSLLSRTCPAGPCDPGGRQHVKTMRHDIRRRPDAAAVAEGDWLSGRQENGSSHHAGDAATSFFLWMLQACCRKTCPSTLSTSRLASRSRNGGRQRRHPARRSGGASAASNRSTSSFTGERC